MKRIISICFALLPLTTGCILPLCVVEGTVVATPAGPVNIENIQNDQTVVCLSDSGSEEVGRVVSTVTGSAGAYLQVQLVSPSGVRHLLEITDFHPLATDTGWTPANRLKSGDLVRTRDGDCRIQAINSVSRNVRVYDLTVEPHHNYFANGVLVHNKSYAAPPSRDAMLGVWVGQMDDGWSTLMRMELRPDGTGLLACTAGSKDPRLYEISEWGMDKWNMTFKVHQVQPGGDTRGLSIHGKSSGWRSMQLEVRTQRHDTSWDRELVRMRRESDIERDLETLKQRMARQPGSLRPSK